VARPLAAGTVPNRLALAAWLLLPIAAHVGFSSFGFNPTDDGFILAMSRRLLDGQIPHRDFISIRPVGSALLHLPEAWLGGALTLWLGRFVAWCEFALIAFCWVDLAARITRRPVAPSDRFLRGVAAFVLGSHVFPPMPWHTVDAVALASAGVWLVTRGGAAALAGFALIGGSALCRQNFLLLPAIAILGLGHARSWRAWLAACAPALLYVVALAALGALTDARIQLTTRVDVWRWGVAPYLRSLPMWGGVALGLVIAALTRDAGRARAGARQAIGLVTLGLTVAGAGSTLGRTDGSFVFPAMFLLFGVCLGLLAARLHPGARGAGGTPLLILALATAWSASVSIGYATPALAAGALFAAAFHIAATGWRARHADRVERGSGRRRSMPRAVALAVALALGAFWVPARLHQIYRDRPAAELDRPLGAVLPGGSMIRTGESTYEFLQDLQRAVGASGGHAIVVVPDCAAYWIRSPQRNPLPLDWLTYLEMGRPELLDRIEAAIAPGHEGRRLLVQKASALRLAEGFVPLAGNDRMYAVVGFIRATHRKVGETRWFEIYE
jgi:hypothetical protein